MWRLLLGTTGVKSLVQGLNAAATAGFEPRTVWSEVRRRNRLATAPPNLALRLKRPLDTLGHVVELLLRKRYNVFAEGGWLRLSPTLVVHGKDGSDRRTGHRYPQFETFIFVCCALVLCTFSLFHACFLAFGAADGSCQVHGSRQCGCHEGLELQVGTLTPKLRWWS